MKIFLNDIIPNSFILLEKEELINLQSKEEFINRLSLIYCPTMDEP
jgi:hypothetical protein